MLIRLRLRTKRDGSGRSYLFAALPAISSVLFVYELGDRDPRGFTHELELKPYTGSGRSPPAQANGSEAADPSIDDEFAKAWAADGDRPKPAPTRRAA